MRQAHRFSGPGQPYEGLTELRSGKPTWTGKVRLEPEMLSIPLRRKKPTTFFVNSMSDLFHEDITDEQVAAIFAVMAACPQHTFQLLTKRSERLPKWFEWIARRAEAGRAMFPDDSESWLIGQMLAVVLSRTAGLNGYRRGTKATGYRDFDPRRQPWPLPNVHLGVSCEDQVRADERIPHLLSVPAAVRWISAEPLLAPIKLAQVPGFNKCGQAGIDLLANFWVVVGGESGPGARSCDLSWVRSIVAQCRTSGVPVFVKQLGAVACEERLAPANWTISDLIALNNETRDPLFSTWTVTNTGTPGYKRRHGDDSCDDAAHQQIFVRLARLADSKGGNPLEWPEELRVREFPRVRNGGVQ
jgi:protein gp37